MVWEWKYKWTSRRFYTERNRLNFVEPILPSQWVIEACSTHLPLIDPQFGLIHFKRGNLKHKHLLQHLLQTLAKLRLPCPLEADKTRLKAVWKVVATCFRLLKENNTNCRDSDAILHATERCYSWLCKGPSNFPCPSYVFTRQMHYRFSIVRSLAGANCCGHLIQPFYMT